uniref:Uncharacterized protein n=1 Tax=Physcomitrium patens TaxID=3218 RepID=A0A7I4EVK4_PHYPA
MWCNVANARIANSLSNFLQQPATTPRSEGLTRNKRSAFHTFFRFHYFNWPRNEGRCVVSCDLKTPELGGELGSIGNLQVLGTE